jgi:magnesium transporter
MGMIVDCAAYAEGCRVGSVTLDEIPEVLRHDGRFVWLGLYEPDEALLARVQAVFGLHDLAVEDAHRAHQRPKLEEYGETLFVVLRTAQADDEGRVAFGETHVFVAPRYVVTVRHGASLSYAAVRARCESAPDLLGKGPGFVLYAIMDFVVDQYFPIVQGIEEALDRVDERLFEAQQTGEMTERIYRMKQELIALKRAVLPLQDVCNRLIRFDVKIVPEDARPYFRDVYDHVIRINESIDTLRELLTSALEANLALSSLRQNEVMKKLGGWAAILGVPTLLASVYGMNFTAMPELAWTYGYPLALGLMVASSGWLYLRFKRDGWL